VGRVAAFWWLPVIPTTYSTINTMRIETRLASDSLDLESRARSCPIENLKFDGDERDDDQLISSAVFSRLADYIWYEFSSQTFFLEVPYTSWTSDDSFTKARTHA
jgi:hypothetical protein